MSFLPLFPSRARSLPPVCMYMYLYKFVDRRGPRRAPGASNPACTRVRICKCVCVCVYGEFEYVCVCVYGCGDRRSAVLKFCLCVCVCVRGGGGAGEAPYAGLKFCMYEAMKRSLAKLWGVEEEDLGSELNSKL